VKGPRDQIPENGCRVFLHIINIKRRVRYRGRVNLSLSFDIDRYACLKITQKNVWVLFKKTKVGCHSSETKDDRNKLERPDDGG
jgi:hypothetical protein